MQNPKSTLGFCLSYPKKIGFLSVFFWVMHTFAQNWAMRLPKIFYSVLLHFVGNNDCTWQLGALLDDHGHKKVALAGPMKRGNKGGPSTDITIFSRRLITFPSTQHQSLVLASIGSLKG